MTTTLQAAAPAPALAMTSADSLNADLACLVGAANVRSDTARRALHSQDIWGNGASTVECVVAPGNLDELAAVVTTVARAGLAIAPRGAGMSYTSGYVPSSERTVSLDMGRMNRIVAIDAVDMTVTVEAGCTWSALWEALKPLGLRTPFWGPMSGLTSTIGGGLSQLNAMLGAGHHGTSSESVVGMTLVLANGTILRTGGRGAEAGEGDAGEHVTPFYRHYGPDLAGLFCGDSGTLGIKALVTLRLMRNPAHEGYVSFAFKTGAALLEAMAEMARVGVASEMCAFDPGLTRVRMKRGSLAGDVKTLAAVVGKQKSLMKGLVEAGRVAFAGRDFVADGDYSLHVIGEGRCSAAVEFDIATARGIAAKCGGNEIENTIAKVIRAQPFPPLNSVLGPAGERWAPIHGIASLSKAAAVFDAVQAVFADMAESFAREGVSVGHLFTSLSTNALIVEPVFYWPDARGPIHELAIQPDHLARLPVLPANPVAHAVVLQARERVLEVFARFGCAHFQIGRTYPYRASRDAASWQLLNAVKHEVDPAGRLNPGGLGLGA